MKTTSMVLKSVNDRGDGCIDVVMTSPTRDRDGDIVEPGGANLERFRANPVVLWAHDNTIPPIGRVTEIREFDDRIEATIQFDLADPFAAMVYGKYIDGFLSAVSIGFLPGGAASVERLSGGGHRIREWEQLELSCVPVPSNPDALRVRGAEAWRKACVEWAERTIEAWQKAEIPAPPDRFREQLRIGLEWHEQGFSGDGLLPSTVREARSMAEGNAPSEDKVKRGYAFMARHLAQNHPMRDDNGDPTPYAVAIKLWGGKDEGPPYWRRAMRAIGEEVDSAPAAKAGQTLSQSNVSHAQAALEHLAAMLASQGVDAVELLSDKGEKMSAKLKATPTWQDLPLADREREWDSDAAVERLRELTGSTDSPDVGYRQYFFWYDEDNADQYGAYKLPYADVIDGEVYAVPRAIFAVAGALEGARGGVDIPEGDRAAVLEHVGRYYAKMAEEFDDDSIVAPWDAPEQDSMHGDEDEEMGGGYKAEHGMDAMLIGAKLGLAVAELNHAMHTGFEVDEVFEEVAEIFEMLRDAMHANEGDEPEETPTEESGFEGDEDSIFEVVS